ncbi:MAG: hypothetical protein WC069_05255 [Candidatus Shapirobacteria bacterium]
MTELVQNLNEQVVTQFKPHIEGLINNLVERNIDLNDMGRAIHEYDSDLASVNSRRLEVAGRGYDKQTNRGELCLWDIDYSKPNYPTKMVYVDYSLQGSGSRVDSITAWPTVCPSQETDDAFLDRIGPQLDVMVQEREDIKQK